MAYDVLGYVFSICLMEKCFSCAGQRDIFGKELPICLQNSMMMSLAKHFLCDCQQNQVLHICL